MNKLLSSMGVALGVTLAAPFAVAGGDAAKGQPLTAVCAACHSADGNSALASFPKLAGLGERYLLKQMKDIKSGARPIVEMTGLLDNMSDEDLANIAAYYNSKVTQLSGSKDFNILVNSGTEVNALELGTRVYRNGNKEAGIPACTGCHSPRGQGNEPAGYPRLSGQHADYIAKQLQDFRAGRRANDEAKVMRGVAERMTDAEITAVANFIAGLN
ncbi:c-type cytochrome [Marinagarivorans algicola]|uniref:c-type cytochrome n=1 Tax=Marinagarivorans algicola TaxID=1513270 RepID=UPI0006B5B861|nr:c-type cytochrome [Marinagarivorans algicola]